METENRLKTKLNQIFSTLTQGRCRKEPVLEFEDECIEEQEQDVSTQFLQTQKNQLIDFQDDLERSCNVLPAFGFNSKEYDINLIKGYLLPLFINERGIESKVIKTANQFVSLKFGDVELLDISNSLGGATSLDFFLKANNISETKVYFPYEWFNDPEKLNNTQLPPYETFFSKLCIKNHLEKDCSDFQILIDGGLTSKETLSKLKLMQPSATGQNKYHHYLTSVWQQENMCSPDFLR